MEISYWTNGYGKGYMYVVRVIKRHESRGVATVARAPWGLVREVPLSELEGSQEVEYQCPYRSKDESSSS
jgi:hypothetical protein